MLTNSLADFTNAPAGGVGSGVKLSSSATLGSRHATISNVIVINSQSGGVRCNDAGNVWNEVTITGMTISGSVQEAILYTQSNATISSNTITGITTSIGIAIGSSSNRIVISGNVIHGNTPASGTGISLGSSSNVEVYGNILSGVLTPIQFSGTNQKIYGNIGYVNAARLQSPNFALDSTGVKTVTVAHGLAAAPSLTSISVTVVQNTVVTDWAYAYIEIVSVDATNIVIGIKISTASLTGGATAFFSVLVTPPM
jgi:hypothetical protein